MSSRTRDPSSSRAVVRYVSYEHTFQMFAAGIESGGRMVGMSRAANMRLWQALGEDYQHRRLLRAPRSRGGRTSPSLADVDFAIESARVRAKEQFARFPGTHAHLRPQREELWGPLLPHVVVLTDACLLRFWSDELAVVSLWHETTGWVEIDVPTTALPAGAPPGSRFPIALLTDEQGRILDWNIEWDAQIASPSAVQPHPLRPREPADWDDPAEVARYRAELNRLFEPNHGQ